MPFEEPAKFDALDAFNKARIFRLMREHGAEDVTLIASRLGESAVEYDDDEIGMCPLCFHPVRYRGYIPEAVRVVCLPCAVARGWRDKIML